MSSSPRLWSGQVRSHARWAVTHIRWAKNPTYGGPSDAPRPAPATARRAQGHNALLRAPQTTQARPPRARIGLPTVGSKGGLAHRTWDFSSTERGIPPCFRREPRPSNVGTYKGAPQRAHSPQEPRGGHGGTQSIGHTTPPHAHLRRRHDASWVTRRVMVS